MRSALERYTTPARSCRLRRTTQRRLRARFRRHVALGSRPASNPVQPARPHQAASHGPRRPKKPLAQLRWASSPQHRWRSRTGVCDQAGGRPSLSVEVHVRRAAARRLPYRRAASQRGGLGRPHAWSQMPAPPAYSEPIQSRQPVTLASAALLLRRARLDDAVGRLGLLPHWAPRPHHSLLVLLLAARPSSSEAQN